MIAELILQWMLSNSGQAITSALAEEIFHLVQAVESRHVAAVAPRVPQVEARGSIGPINAKDLFIHDW
jgi:hypothetical protein